MLFRSASKLNIQSFFRVTNVLLIIFAAGLVAYGVHEFNEAGIIPSIIEHVWDINGFINEKSQFGLILKALVGYNGNPSLTEVIAYLAYLTGIITYVATRKQKAWTVSPSAAA
jgi:high-affinity iron transporter